MAFKQVSIGGGRPKTRPLQQKQEKFSFCNLPQVILASGAFGENALSWTQPGPLSGTNSTAYAYLSTTGRDFESPQVAQVDSECRVYVRCWLPSLQVPWHLCTHREWRRQQYSRVSRGFISPQRPCQSDEKKGIRGHRTVWLVTVGRHSD